ncbi:MAG: DinB family protein, partial [Blastocatellia bacterium]
MKVLLSTILATLMIPAAHPAFTAAKSGPVRTESSSDSKSSDGKMTEQERAALIELLTKTKADFIASIQNVNAAQWTFKPTPFTWSVSEAAEHIILSEDLLFGVSQSLLKTLAKTPPASSNSQGDQKLEAFVGDRTHKVFNPDALKPTGRFKTPVEAIAE